MFVACWTRGSAGAGTQDHNVRSLYRNLRNLLLN